MCAASKGLGRGCAEALAREGVDVTICARTESEVARAAGRDRRRGGAPRRLGRLRHHDPRGPRGGAGRLSGARHPGQQRRRSATRRFPRLGPRRVDPGARCEHADADRADQGDHRRHDRAQLRAHRQHHVERGQGADRHAGPVQWRALGAHRLRRGARAQGRPPQRHDQQPAAGTVRDRPPAREFRGLAQGRRQVARRGAAGER